MNEEKSSNDPTAGVEFSPILKDKFGCENLNLDNVYNADESGILWRKLTACTHALRSEEEIYGRKDNKDRVTALFCANATGSYQLPLLIVGKSKNPSCLSNLKTKYLKNQCMKNLESLGIIYTYQSNAWMDRIIFMLW